MPRSFRLTDIVTLHRFRKQGLFLDSQYELIWGQALVPFGAIFAALVVTTGLVTAYHQDEEKKDQPLFGQVKHKYGTSTAHFTFLSPASLFDSPAFSSLLDHLVYRIGDRGAHNLVADVDEKAHTLEALRRASFSVYARQNLWRLTGKPRPTGHPFIWRNVRLADEINVHKLYNTVVPALIQQIEPVPFGRARAWVAYQGDELRAFVDVIYGTKGVWVQPFIHPEMEDPGAHLVELLRQLTPKKKRPVYLCLRSYQSHLSAALEDLGAELGPTQAVMVRRLAVEIKESELARIPQMNGSAEPTTTYVENSATEEGIR